MEQTREGRPEAAISGTRAFSLGSIPAEDARAVRNGGASIPALVMAVPSTGSDEVVASEAVHAEARQLVSDEVQRHLPAV